MFAIPKNTADATASPASTGARKPRLITAEITAHQIILSGGTYPLRNDIREHGFSYNKSDETWRAPYTPGNETYARSIASNVVTIGNVPSDTPQAPDVPAMLARAMRDQSNIPPHVDDDDQTPTDQPRRRIKRTAEPDQTPTQTPTQQTDIAAALAAFVATVQANQPAPAPQAPAIDFDAVKQLISAALVPIIEKLNQRPTERLDIVQNGDVVRTVDGAHHAMLPTLIKCLTAGVHVWLAGPSGSGKTHGAEQAATALGLTFRLQGAMTMAHELTGFVDAGGRYHETPFVTTFRNGGVILLDELDAGSNEALLALNAALANGIMCLPSGEIIRAHADFKCIGAANTFGAGATADYVGRTRIDAAFLQRFGARLTWAYDEALETALTGDAAWSARVQNARAKAKANGLKVLITPRASINGRKLMSVGFTADEVANMTYLADLSPDQRRMVD